MIRLFKVHYPLRTLVLLAGEAVVVWASFLLGVLWSSREDSWLALNAEGGYFKILAATAIILLISHGLDRYDAGTPGEWGPQTFRQLLAIGLAAVVLGMVALLLPAYLPASGATVTGVVLLTVLLFLWRVIYGWLVKQPFLRERIFVLGTGERAERLVRGLQKPELGFDVVGWTGNLDGELTRDRMAAHLLDITRDQRVHRVIVALPDRRGTLPVTELLNLRLSGVKVEEATSWLEKIDGRIEVEQLHPSWLIFSDGFRISNWLQAVRRVLSTLAAAVGLLVALPLIPFILLAITLDSPGPVLYRQKRVGRAGSHFYCYKFRTMRRDAEADTGATWATDDDPRITRIGRFLRLSRLDEIPQLWCVLKSDMAFVGPRPERPEFVDWLSREIPYYGVRHAVRPGITGWAQVQYKYGNTLEDAREKLQYDLFYIKNASLGLDLLIMFQTIKIVLLGRGAQ